MKVRLTKMRYHWHPTRTWVVGAVLAVYVCWFSIHRLWMAGIIVYDFDEPKDKILDIILDPLCVKPKRVCQVESECLIGNRDVRFQNSPSSFLFPTWPIPLEKLNKMYNFPDTKNGVILPQTCLQPTYPSNKIAIIIPYRGRPDQLKLFLTYMIPVFLRQQLEFKIYIVEQFGMTTFNRAKLLNVGYMIAKNDHPWDCYVFHDVDLVLENDKNTYRCHPSGIPQHFLVAWSKYNYRLIYDKFFGGIVQVTGSVYEKVNGHSNMYWGWGGEDDDFYERIMKHGGFKSIHRPNRLYARYKMVPHVHEKSNAKNPTRKKLLGNGLKRHNLDGLSDLTYTVKSRNVTNIYGRYVVDVGRPLY